MKLIDLVAVLDRHAPFDTALSFDNSGILCGDPTKESYSILRTDVYLEDGESRFC